MQLPAGKRLQQLPGFLLARLGFHEAFQVAKHDGGPSEGADGGICRAVRIIGQKYALYRMVTDNRQNTKKTASAGQWMLRAWGRDREMSG